eukprot:m.188833 g.188833  ORF g.188833 m.188833 type:complete len:1127 (-) comp16734_c1_seq1:3793-7173(-)
MRSPAMMLAVAIVLLSAASASTAQQATHTTAEHASCSQLPVWPLPSHCSLLGNTTITIHPAVSIETDSDNQILQSAIQRYSSILLTKFVHKERGPLEPHLKPTSFTPTDSHPPLQHKATPLPYLTTVHISILDDSETLKTVDSNETYTLTVSSPVTHITAGSVWGAMYALETLSQLPQYNATTQLFTLPSTPLTITDSPSYPMRGIMVDSANHFITPQTIRRLLDAMAYNKMNVLHWHLIDSYSFPMMIASRPALANAGSWAGSPTTYSREDMRDIQQYAQERGIRVVPEIDVPGHAYSWGFAYPDIIVDCPPIHSTDIGSINVIPLDPTKPLTYQVLQDIIQATTELFPDAMLHVGGDEVQYECWKQNSAIQAWMKEHGIADERELEIYFETQLMAMLKQHTRRAVVWDEAFTDMKDSLDKSVVVEVWDDDNLLLEVLKDGHDGLFASGWYLDRQVPYANKTHWFWLDTWADMYSVAFPTAPPSGGRILGGEAPMWSEQVSDLSFDARVWPRAMAVAERLWNQQATDAFNAAQRLGVHRCRMSARGIPVGPIWADYCSHDTQSMQVQQLSSPQPGVHMTVGETCALLLFIFFLGIFFVWFLAACCGVGFSIRQIGTQGTTLSTSKKTAAPTTGSVQEDQQQLSDETTPLLSSGENDLNTSVKAAEVPQHTAPKERLSSLDVFRGFTVALMIFVDEAGSAFPPIDHSPWDGIRLADFVMPFFDFIVGVSLALSFKKFDLESSDKPLRRTPALRKATIRFLKLFFIGMLTQGGIDIMNYDLAHIRIMGILQRVAVCYYAVALMEIYLPRSTRNRDYNLASSFKEWAADILHMFWRYKWHWFTALCLFGTHTGIMYGVDVPPAFGEECGRGVLTPPCNAATFIDKHIFTVEHMYFPSNGGQPDSNDVTFQRLPECSTCSPGKCVPPENAPAWCLEGPFDPEGIVSSLNAIITTIIGIHYGHILRRIQDPRARMIHWSIFGAFQLALGLILHFTGAFPMNTDLYSISYTLVTGGTAGLLVPTFYGLVDRLHVGVWLWTPFMYMGMNAIVMYLAAEGGILQYIFESFYWNKEENSLVNILWPTGVFWGDSDERPYKPTYNYQVMLWVIAYIGIWMLLARYMYHRRMFVTI